MSNRIGANRYPRHGERIAPSTLRPVLFEPVPDGFQPPSGRAPLRLCDLDERIWEQMSSEALGELAELVVDRVAAGCGRKLFEETPFPRPPENANLSDLNLEHRTHLCLSREGFDKDLQSLGNHTIGEILSLRAFGPRCLVDLLSALETLLARHSVVDPALSVAAERLAALSQAARVRANDPRFGKSICAVDAEAAHAADLANRLLRREHVPPDRTLAARQVEALCQGIEEAEKLPVEQELIEIFASGVAARNRDILLGYYGWTDGKRHTLSEIGSRFGITRERTRQICAKLTRRHRRPETIFAPVVEQVLAFIEQRTPCSSARIETELAEQGWTASGLGVESILDSAKLLKRPVGFALEWVGIARRRRVGLVVATGEAGLVGAAIEVARREIYYHGIATLKQVCSQMPDRLSGRGKEQVVCRAIEALPGFLWLDEKQGWFRVASISKHGLP